MKQIFLKKEGNDNLLLFFAGWGADENLFKYKGADGYDYMICFDYTTLDFDFSEITGYKKIRLIAWSMGVWAASQTFSDKEIPWEIRIAINGTNTPIDDSYGIPVAIFNGTLDSFSAVTLSKFRRRMCGSANGVKEFLARQPYRTLEELRNELSEIKKQVLESGTADFTWDKAVISANDRIFPAGNMYKAFSGIPVKTLNTEHFDAEMFNSYLNGKEDEWTRI